MSADAAAQEAIVKAKQTPRYHDCPRHGKELCYLKEEANSSLHNCSQGSLKDGRLIEWSE